MEGDLLVALALAQAGVQLSSQLTVLRAFKITHLQAYSYSFLPVYFISLRPESISINPGVKDSTLPVQRMIGGCRTVTQTLHRPSEINTVLSISLFMLKQRSNSRVYKLGARAVKEYIVLHALKLFVSTLGV